MPTVEEQVGTLVAEQATLVAEVIAERTARQTSVTNAETAEDGAIAAQGAAETARDASAASAADSAQSASVATAAAAALVGTEGIIPTASEILWLSSKPQAGVNALGFFDTGARLLSGVSERALLRYGEDNDTLNFMLLDGGVDGVRLDFTAEGAVFAATGAATPGDSAVTVLDQSEGATFGVELITNGDFASDLTGWTIVGSDWNWSAGKAVDAGTGSSSIAQTITTVVGRSYLLTATAYNVAGGIPSVSVTGVGSIHTWASGTVQSTVEKIFVATSTSTNISFSGTLATWELDNVSVREIPGTHATQPNAALQGKFGKAPKVVRNLLKATADLTSGLWQKTTSVVSPGVEPGSFKIARSGDAFEAVFQILGKATSALTFTYTLEIKKDIGDFFTLTMQGAGSGNRLGICFNIETGAVALAPVSLGAFSSLDAQIESVGDGYFRATISFISDAHSVISVYMSPSSVARQNVDGTVSGSGPASAFIRKPQIELGSTATPYQAVGASDLDVTESGVQSFGFYRPDLSDDVLPLTVPAIDGDILIAGKKGTWIEPAAPSAGAFNIGPTTYTGGTPGILQAVGDITGVELIDKTLSTEERARLVAYFRARGAKGLLVPGPELAINSSFDDATGLTFGNGFSVSGGQLLYDGSDSGTFGKTDQTVSTEVGATYLVSLDLVSIAGGSSNLVVFVSGFGVVSQQSRNTAGKFQLIFVAPSTAARISPQQNQNPNEIVWDNISIRKLLPEEEW